jgi:NAD(P)-dependent dehydrogenase (short-subunit alcohol dehydrogenase family)
MVPTNPLPHSRSTALITGASRGLGAALAGELAQRGWHLILDARTASDLDHLATQLSASTTVEAIAGDVADPAHRQQLREAAAASGGIDVLVNNAGILGPSPQPQLLAYPIDTLEQVFRVNVLAPLALIQILAPVLADDARIINLTSDAAIEAYEGWGGYGASKAALEQLTNVLAAEQPDWRVYRVDPGDMRTRMHQEAFPGEDISDRPTPAESVPGVIELITGAQPSGRYQARVLAADVERSRPSTSHPVTEAA